MRRRRVFWAIVGLGLCGWVAAAVWVDRTGVAASRAEPGCATVVLGARVEAGGIPSPTLEERIREGIRLHQRVGGLLVFTGGVGDFSPAESELGAQIARRSGVAAEHIRIEAKSHSTRENAREAMRLIRPEGIACVNVVSDPFHLARARWAFEREGVRTNLVPVRDAPHHVSLAARVFWTLREVPAFVRMIALEWVTYSPHDGTTD